MDGLAQRTAGAGVVFGRGRSGKAGWLPMGAVLLVAALAGCGDKSSGGVQRLSPRGTPYLDGVPVPANFRLIEKMTEDYESGAQRTARHEYRGFANAQAVRNFYREQMPLVGWTRVSDQNVKGVVSLRFEKRNEACTVQIEPGWFNYTTIRAIVNPFNRTAPSEPPKRPVP